MEENEFHIDKITKSIEDATAGVSFDIDVVAIESKDLKAVLKKYGWRFNWKTESIQHDRKVYKLVAENNSSIQGSKSLQVVENYIEMHLIGTAPHNYGSVKKFVGVPGDMEAFA